jgi:hypothetical protein
MEGNNYNGYIDYNGYFMPTRNEKRYTPFEFDKMMSKNENRMDNLGKIIDSEIINYMMSSRKTPLTLTPKLILENNNAKNALGPKLNTNNLNNQSQRILRNPLQKISNESFRIPQNSRYMNNIQRQQFINEENNMINNNKQLQNNLNDEFTKYNPEEDISSQHWKYDGPTGYNLERKHYPRMANNGNFYRNDEPVKINKTDFNEDLYNRNADNYSEPLYIARNRDIDYNNNNNFRSQEIPRSRRNNSYMERRRPTPYNEGNNDRNYDNNGYNNGYNNIHENDRYNNYNEENNMELRNRSFRAFSTRNNEKINDKINEDEKDNASYVKRGYYNSQLNFPYDRYQK